MGREELVELQREVTALRADLATLKRDMMPQVARYPAQQTAAAGGVYFGVVREIGSGTGNTIMLQRLVSQTEWPYWRFSDGPAQEVHCMPDTVAAHYEYFLCTASTWADGQAMRPILVLRTGHGPVAIPWVAFAL